MILTVTPNPSLDRAFDLTTLERGAVQRANAVHIDPGGKGINVSRVLVRHGIETLAIVPAGGPDGRQLVDLLAHRGVPALAVPVAGETRGNITLAERDGTTTKINAVGPELTADEVNRLVITVRQRLAVGDVSCVVAAGSLPGGRVAGLLPRIGAVAADAGVPYAVDTSGEALREAVADGGLEVVKPNDEELAELVGSPVVTVGDAVDAARGLIARGTRHVLVSLGAHGALLVTADGSWWAGGPALTPLSTVGAGDVTLAGFLAATGTPAARLRAAVAWGRAAVLLPGSAVPGPEQIDPSQVSVVIEPDQRTILKEL